MSRLRSIVASAVLVIPIVATASPPAHAAGTVPSAISLSAPASGTYGSNITLQGRLWRYGTSYGIGGALVWLQRKPHGQQTWANIKNARTASNGNYAFAVTQTGAYDYRTVYTGSATYRVAISPTRYPVTNQRMSFESIATVNASTGALHAVGYVYPLPPNGLPVYLQRWDPEARVWHNLASGRTSGGKVTVGATRPGSINAYRLVVPARSSYGAGISAAKWFAHYVWRGGFVKGLIAAGGSGQVLLASTAESPGRDLATVTTDNLRTSSFSIDSTGCRQVSTRTSYYAGGTKNLHLNTRRGEIARATVYRNGPAAVMAGSLTATDTWVELYLSNIANEYSAVRPRVTLLCSN